MPLTTNKIKLVALLGPVAAAAVIGFTSLREGVSLTPYKDTLAHNLATVCYGDTEVQMRKYTSAECKALLGDRLADYADAVRTSTTGFDKLTDGQKVALVDFTYNTGIATYQKSTLRKLASAGQFPAACEQFMRYRFAGGKDCAVASNQCSGIMKRREAERAACLGE